LVSDVTRTLGIVLAVAWLSCPTKAQEQPAPDWQYKVEVFGNIAHGRFYHGAHVWGKGLDYGGGVGVRPFNGWLRRLGFEVQMARMKKSEELSAAQSQSLSSRLVMANALYHFHSGTKAQPYVFVGLGHVKADHVRLCRDCILDWDPVTGKPVSRGVTEWRNEGSKMGVTTGVGLKIAVHRHLSIRPELLLVNTTPGSGWNWGWVRLQIGLGAHF
jgi:opacity protein-like surface antigen